MKKIIALLLCACVLLLAGCGGADDSAETTVAAPEGDLESASPRMISDDECELKVPVTRTDSTKSEVTLTAVKVDGSWRLNDIYEG